MPEVTLEMSSPQHNGPEIPSGSAVDSEADGAAKSHKPDVRLKGKETPQSPFKVPESNKIFQQSISEKEEQKEETQTFLALPIDKKTTHTVRMMAKLKKALVEPEEEEEGEKGKEKVKSLKQVKSEKVLQTPARQELKKAMMKRENTRKDSKHDLISMERQKAVLELSLMQKKTEMLRMDKCIGKEEEKLKTLEKIIERDNLKFEEFLRENEKKSVEARTLFEREAKSKQDKNVEIKKLTAEIWTVQSELTKFEETLLESKRYKDLLFKLSPPEWQEAQKLKAVKAKAPSHKEESPVEESSIRNDDVSAGLDNEVSGAVEELPSIRETSAASDTESIHPTADSSEYEDEPALYFTEPQQLLDQVTELTEQNLSLIQASARAEGTLVEMRQLLDVARKKIEKDEEQLKRQINDMNARVNKERKRGAKLKQKVQLHVSLNTEDQDLMLKSLGDKVAVVHSCCVDDRLTNISTLEKLTNIEKRMSMLLQDLETIPEDSLEMMKKIKESERRSREREEKLREQQEKQKERTKRYTERSMSDSKKITGRKLMPRCMPAAPKSKVSNVDDGPAEDEIHASLYSTEDME